MSTLLVSCIPFLLLLFLHNHVGAAAAAAAATTIVDTLPGYPGPLPFKLETGYVRVGEEDEEAHDLFYYFIESESDPQKDPLIFWMAGGPGCSGLSSLVYEIGPLKFNLSSFDGNLPSLFYNTYSWTKVASIIFIDSPVGTGFSYANATQAYNTSDTKATTYDYMFLRRWLMRHPSFIKNHLYIAGSSYGGKRVPMVASAVANGNEAGLEPSMSLQGYIIGNGPTDENERNVRVEYAHRMALISDEYYDDARTGCSGQYLNPDPTNLPCVYALRRIKDCIDRINLNHILEPQCEPYNDADAGFLMLSSKQEQQWCRDKDYLTSDVWASDPSVQEALGVRKGSKKVWKRCNADIQYEIDVPSVLGYHQLMNEKGYQIFVFSGDHDMGFPYLGTLRWIRNLNISLHDEWRPWLVDGQIAGYVEKHKNKGAFVTFATVKGAGHTPPEYSPRQCFAMINRWLSLYPL